MRIAAIDVGTNSVHMLVCRIRPDLSFEVVDREKDMIRLGAGSLDGRTLTPAAIQTAIETLKKFRRLAESHGVDEIIASATSAVREAENGGDFLAAARRQVGLRIRVISGTEEARLIHLAAAYATGVGRRPSVVIDIGGGSCEITLGTSARVELGRSFKLGALRMTERYGRTDPLSAKDERRLARHVRRETKSYLRQIERRGFYRVIGTSGTILSIGALATGRREPVDEVRNVRVSAKAIHRLRKRLTNMTMDQRLKIPGLDPRRADLAPVGAVVIDTLLDELGAEELTLCDFALREGLVLEYIRRNQAHIRSAERYPDVRRRSVIELAERCGYWPVHAQQVARLALQIFDATRGLHGLGAREREWLEFGALLHDIGIHISYEGHHKHSYYLVRNGGLRGFEPQEIPIIGLIARYHRQGTPKKDHEGFVDLPARRRDTVSILGAILRLAEGLDRSHAQVVDRVYVTVSRKRLRLRLRIKGDAELELWAAHRHTGPLAKLFEREIVVEAGTRTRKARSRSRKDAPRHAEHARGTPFVPRPAVRRGGHRRLRQDHAARLAS
jgi:exopolyphosphatase / guanosine-5'-triphosphate,3'-diphosphate pyrophosphatase